jgi:hypothetical protein
MVLAKVRSFFFDKQSVATTGITNPVVDVVAGPITRQSALDKKNMKKRAAKNLSPEEHMPGIL